MAIIIVSLKWDGKLVSGKGPVRTGVTVIFPKVKESRERLYVSAALIGVPCGPALARVK